MMQWVPSEPSQAEVLAQPRPPKGFVGEGLGFRVSMGFARVYVYRPNLSIYLSTYLAS